MTGSSRFGFAAATAALLGMVAAAPVLADEFQDQINRAQKTLSQIDQLTTNIANRQASAGSGTSTSRTVTTASSETKVMKKGASARGAAKKNAPKKKKKS